MILAYWRWIVLAVLLVGAAAFGGSVVYRHMDAKLRALQSDFDVFRGGVAALGKAAEIRAKETEAANQKRKELADAQSAKTKRDLAGLYDAYQRLRDQRDASGGILSGTRPAAGSAERTDLDTGAANRALSAFDAGVTGLLREGDEGIGKLNDARAWAQGR